MVLTNADFVRNQCSNGISHFLLFFAFSGSIFLEGVFFPKKKKKRKRQRRRGLRHKRDGARPNWTNKVVWKWGSFFVSDSAATRLSSASLHHHLWQSICLKKRWNFGIVLHVFGGKVFMVMQKVSFFLVGNPTGNSNVWCQTSRSFQIQNASFFCWTLLNQCQKFNCEMSQPCDWKSKCLHQVPCGHQVATNPGAPKQWRHLLLFGRLA